MKVVGLYDFWMHPRKHKHIDIHTSHVNSQTNAQYNNITLLGIAKLLINQYKTWFYGERLQTHANGVFKLPTTLVPDLAIDYLDAVADLKRNDTNI